MKFFALFTLLLVFSSCDREPGLEVSMAYLLHDNSSKVWMVQSEIIGEEELAPKNNNFKTVLIFYNDFSYAEQPLNSIGNRPPVYGTYEVEYQNEALSFVLSRNKNTFKVVMKSKSMVVLESRDDTGQKIVITLVPLPKI